MKIKKLIIFIVFLAFSLPLIIKAEEKNGWYVENNETYYYENGKKASGFKEIEGETYFFGLTTNKMLKGWQSVAEGRFYLNSEGKIKQGWNEIDGEKYYVENNYMVSGFKEIDGETYFFGLTTNKMLKGWQSVAEGRFYLNNEGKIKQGWNEINKEKYYVENNYMVSGFKEIDGETYFFGLTTNKMLKGWQSVAEGRFYLNSEGKIKRGWNEIDGEKYYVENNYMVSGFKEINGEKYFFGLTTNKLLHDWNNIGYNYWYQDENGKMLTRLQTIEGRDYLFDDNGYLQGFKNINGKLYYFNPDGTQAKGVQRMAGLYFKFDSITGEFEKYVNQKIVIDVSSHNGYINWDQVKNAGIVDGVILRLGYSVGFIDTTFLQNVKELNRLRIPYSVYLFSYAVNPYEAGLEADFVIRTIRNNPVHIASNLFSIYYDLESWKIDSTGENSNGISKDAYGGMITTFCDKIKNNLGINARVYASKSYVYDRFPSYAWPYATWIAQWGPTITYKEAFEGWQYTNNGSVPGINGRVDMSIFYY